mmetsp:Transcript_10804/g.21694  ORF Transcript_10804/g.21694 Transcript_10804/m.21694 type:complete len:245 (+) Transcript_10804:356-1090(+)
MSRRGSSPQPVLSGKHKFRSVCSNLNLQKSPSFSALASPRPSGAKFSQKSTSPSSSLTPDRAAEDSSENSCLVSKVLPHIHDPPSHVEPRRSLDLPNARPRRGSVNIVCFDPSHVFPDVEILAASATARAPPEGRRGSAKGKGLPTAVAALFSLRQKTRKSAIHLDPELERGCSSGHKNYASLGSRRTDLVFSSSSLSSNGEELLSLTTMYRSASMRYPHLVRKRMRSNTESSCSSVSSFASDR